MKTYKKCQSCGMPIKMDPKKGGTNSDGSRNLMYCSYCYNKGDFTQPDISIREMQLSVKGHLKKMGFPGFMAGWLTKGIPKLERWKNNHQ